MIRKTVVLALAASLAAPALALAQQPAGFDPAKLPAYSGTVTHFTLTPRGDIDGFVLSDGTQVQTPPPLSTQIAYAVKLGDSVTVHGLKAAAVPVVQAMSVTDGAQTVVDTLPPGPPPRRPGMEPGRGPHRGPHHPPHHGPGMGVPLMASGKVQMLLHGPRGEVNGAMLADGTELHLPPPAMARNASLLKPGSTVAAAGMGVANALGRVIMVQRIGPSFDQLTMLAPPPPPPGGPHWHGQKHEGGQR